ncbi:hypothetical protein BGZ67_000881 [Mortierella alpina]|nr:hypothetical protein BGZ67_000881 [Mortierella alpina]
MEYRMLDPGEMEGKPITVSSEMCVSSNNPGLNQISSSLSRTITHEWTLGIGLELKSIFSASISKTYAESASTQKTYTFQVNPGDKAVMKFTPKLYYVVGELEYTNKKGKMLGLHRADFTAPMKDADGYAYGTYWLDVLSSAMSLLGALAALAMLFRP